MAAPRTPIALDSVNGGPFSCSQCHLHEDAENEWKSSIDDLLLCAKSDCPKHCDIMCRGCMTAAHRRRDHKPDTHPNDFPNLSQKKMCTDCRLVFSDDTSAFDLMLCTKDSCTHRFKARCVRCTSVSGCYENHQSDIVALLVWFSLLRMKKIRPDSNTVAAVKNTVKTLVKGAFCAKSIYSTFGKAGMEIISKLPAAASSKDWTHALISACKASKAPAMAVMKSVAKGQAYANGLMFGIECGYYAVDCYFFNNISTDEMWKKIQIAAKANTASFCTSMICAAIGFLIGGPLGAGIGALIGGVGADYAVRKYCHSEKTQEWNEKQRLIRKAMLTFDYRYDSVDELLKDSTFTLDELKRRYHLKAVFNHPDVFRHQGCEETEIQQKWASFYSAYMALLEICQQREIIN